MGVALGDLAMDARDAAVGHGHFFGIIGRMIGAMLVALEPGGIDAERHVGRRCGQPGDDVGREQDVAVAADERLVHQVVGAEQRRQDVVVLPVGVVAERELRIVLPSPCRSDSRR